MWAETDIDGDQQQRAVRREVIAAGPAEALAALLWAARRGASLPPRTSRAKTLGVKDLGSGTDEITQFLASQQGISRSQYQTLAVGAGATAIAAIQRGSAACVLTSQPTVGALEFKHLATAVIDLATASGAQKALGGDWPAAGLLARSDWVISHEGEAQKVVDELVATMRWINTHSATDIANKLPAEFVSNATITKAQYIAGLTTDKGQFLPDSIMPAGGLEVIFAMEKSLGSASPASPSPTPSPTSTRSPPTNWKAPRSRPKSRAATANTTQASFPTGSIRD